MRKRGTETYSGQVAASFVVTDILNDMAGCHRSIRDSGKIDEKAVWIVAERIAAAVDALLASTTESKPVEGTGAASYACSCVSPTPEGNLQIKGKTVVVNGLPLIFEHLHKQGLEPDNGSADQVLETVRIYHAIEPAEENLYRHALAAAYQEYCQRRPKSDVPGK